MERASAPDTQAKRTDLISVDIHAGGIRAGIGGNTEMGKRIYYSIFNMGDQFTYANFSAAKVNKDVSNLLPGTVISHLSTPVTGYHRNITCAQEVFFFTCLALGENRIVLYKPELISGFRCALISKVMHGLKSAGVILAAEVADDKAV